MWKKPPHAEEVLDDYLTFGKRIVQDKLIEHKKYIYRLGEDMPEIRNWKWDAISPGKLE